MAVETLLQNMHNWLREEYFQNSIYQDGGTPPFIIADLGKDPQDRNRFLRILPLFQETLNVLKKDQSDLGSLVSLDFSSELPFFCKPEAAKDLASLLFFINKEIQLSGFSFDEADGKILFRHINYCPEKGIDQRLMIGLTGLILLYIDLYSQAIEEIASGKKTFNETMEELVTAAKEVLKQ